MARLKNVLINKVDNKGVLPTASKNQKDTNQILQWKMICRNHFYKKNNIISKLFQ